MLAPNFGEKDLKKLTYSEWNEKNDFKHDSSLEDTVRYDWSLARGSKEEKNY